MLNCLLVDLGSMFENLWKSSGLASGEWQNYVMILVSFALMYLAIVKKFEPLLLLPIAFGMFLINLPGAYSVLWGSYPDTIEITDSVQLSQYLSAEKYAEILAKQVNWTALTTESFAELALPETFKFVDGAVFYEAAHIYENVQNRGLLWYLFYGVQNVIYPPLIFLGIGAMTDFGPLISNPKSMVIGAAAQLGVFLTLIAAIALGFNLAAAASIAIIGGADGPTAIYVTQKLASLAAFKGEPTELLSAIADRKSVV